MKYMMVLVAVHSSFFARAQSIEEWTNQKATQRKYLREQIIALKVQIAYLQKGYQIAREGLDFISKATKGEWDLHAGYFNSLQQVNIYVRKDPQVAAIVKLQDALKKTQERSLSKLLESNAFSREAIAYIKTVFSRINQDCTDVLEQLEKVIGSGHLQMKDDERLARINSLKSRMQQNLLINEQFASSAWQVAGQRQTIKRSIIHLRNLTK